MKALIPSVLIVGAAIGWLGPDLRSPEDVFKRHDAGASRPGKKSAAAAKPQWYGAALVLDRADDGHFYAPVRIDTRDYRMLVDTGASMIALTGDDARDIGLDWDPNALQPVARGASGVVMGVPVTLPEVAVGDFTVRDVDAVIIPAGLPFSLLGQSYLSHIANVQLAGKTMTLSN